MAKKRTLLKPPKRVKAGKPVAVAAPSAKGLAGIEAWFAAQGWTPWAFQRETWARYRAGESGLVQVATGAGKTYAAFLGPLSELMDEPHDRGGVRVLYITPLRAVTRDISLAMKRPIDDLGLDLCIEDRTGDTTSGVRARQRHRLPEILVTTPESLCLLLTRANAADLFKDLRCIILDEWHELLVSKRGTQTELALARLRGFATRVRTWALSATLPNAAEAAACAVGVGASPPAIVRGEMTRKVTLETVLPSVASRLPWVGHLGLSMLPDVVKVLDPAMPTLIFTNTRSQSERWFSALLVAKPEWEPVMALHHGSIDKAERERVEGGLKDGSIRIVVATSSLDLGVDFSPLERVLQIGSPKGIARLMQRAGRARHRPNTGATVLCVPTFALELFEIAAAREAIERGELEPRSGLAKPLDVLAQHMVTCAMGGGFEERSLLAEVRTAYSYRGLTDEEFRWTLELVAHGGATLTAYPDFHRIESVEGVWRVTKPRLATLHRLNIGTITADTTLEIRYVSGKGLGRIEEHFIAGLREGEKFIYAGKVLQFAFLRDLVAYVRPATGVTNFTPIWGGTRLPISESLAESIRRALERARDGMLDSAELLAAAEIVAVQQRVSIIPRASDVLAEITRTRDGTHLCVFPFEGRAVHGGMAPILALRLARLRKATFSISMNDYGFELLSPDDFPFEDLLSQALFTPEGLAADALEAVNISELARSQFREVARVAGLVFQSYPGARKTGRQVSASAGLIFDVLRDFDPGSLLLAQAQREVIERHFEHSRLTRTLERIGRSTLRITPTARPTPLSFPIMIERLAARLSNESIKDRIERMQKQWAEDASKSPSQRKGLVRRKSS